MLTLIITGIYILTTQPVEFGQLKYHMLKNNLKVLINTLLEKVPGTSIPIQKKYSDSIFRNE